MARQDEAARRLDAADDLDDDVGVGDERLGVGGEERGVDGQVRAVPAGAADGDPDELAADGRRGRRGRRRARRACAATDGPDDAAAEQGHAQGLSRHLLALAHHCSSRPSRRALP